VCKPLLMACLWTGSIPSLTDEKALEYFKTTPKKELTDLAKSVKLPLRGIGDFANEWRFAGVFDKQEQIPMWVMIKAEIIGTTAAVTMKFLVSIRMQGKVVDATKPSLEMKRP